MPLGITLPLVKPKVYDFSMTNTIIRCGRKGYYQYGLHRASVGTNFAIQYGVGYHKFRETIEQLWLKQKEKLDFDIRIIRDKKFQTVVFQHGWNECTKDWKEPPLGHKHDFLTKNRLASACDQAFETWTHEKQSSRYEVLFTEQAFDLALPSGRRYGGRFDQVLEWNRRLWLRDFKTTSRMGKTYGLQFDPNNQFTGYIWAAEKLSGRPIEGVIVDLVYNTKTKGPEFHEFLVTRTRNQIDWWIENIEFELEEIDRMYEKDVWPQRTGSCGDYGGCYFRDACKKSNWHTVDKWLRENTEESVWDFANPEAEKGITD